MMKTKLQNRSKGSIAAIQKLRFFPHSIISGDACYLVEEDGPDLLICLPRGVRPAWDMVIQLS